jgi:putative ABC transport system substrate-binding protein
MIRSAFAGGGNMRRREAMTTIAAGAAAWVAGRGAVAQSTRIPKVGVLLIATREPFWTLFVAGLRDLGYVEGRNIHLELRAANGQAALLPGMAAELVALGVDIIVASETPAVQAARQATASIPIVMAAAGDPLGTGLIASLSRPGGNITGLSAQAAELAGKSLELMREILPSAAKVAVLALERNPLTKPFVENAQRVGETLRFDVRPMLVPGAEAFARVFPAMRVDGIDAVLVQPSLPHRPAAEQALAQRLPAGSVTKSFAVAGGLFSYAASLVERYRGAAVYVDKILKGQKPAELPVGQPTKFELVVNAVTAKSLGLTLPNTLLARADEVLE